MDVEGWQNTRWGMNEDQIIEVVGHEHLRRVDREDFQRFYADLAIPFVNIGEYEFTVRFQMSKDKCLLEQVLVRREGPSSEDQSGVAAEALIPNL